MADTSPKSFLRLLDRSGIVDDDRLKDTLAKLSEQAAGQTIGTPQLTSHLVDAGLITQWHAEKLLAGKYKGFFLGKYKLLGHLGTGGMSSVYLAEHKISGNRRAIKVLPRKRVSDQSYLDRFYREGKAAASLDHPNVVRIYDICNENDTHYMVMEHVKGKDLYAIVKAGGPLPINDAVEYIAQACTGLQHAHQRGMVHRDIKPANLLRTDDGEIKLLDLGLALFSLDDDEESLTVLYNEKVMGTADYLSPEQAVNSHEVDHRADIYSLGCTLYYLLTGHPPFPKGTLAQRIAMHQSKQPDDVRVSRADCPESLVSICLTMMHKNPDGRYQSAEEMGRELYGWLETGQQQGIGLDPRFAIELVHAESAAATIMTSESGSFGDRGPGAKSGSAKSLSSADFQIDTNSVALLSSKSAKGSRSGILGGKGSGQSGSLKASGKSFRNGASSSDIHADAAVSKKLVAAATSSRSFKQIARKVNRSKWLIPAMVTVMFLILLAVLSFASMYLVPQTTTG